MIGIREATAADAAAVREIYAPYVGTAISFEQQVPTVEGMAARIARAQEGYPWLVATEDQRVLGYAYGGPHRQRAAYQWSVEVSAYVAERAHRRGVGRLLYRGLLALLRSQGFVMAYAGITLPNDASVGLHESMGFDPVGVYPDVGFKSESWQSVGWWSLRLRDLPEVPTPPKVPTQMRHHEVWRRILAGSSG